MQLASFLYVFVLLNDHQDFLCFSTSRRRLLSAQTLRNGFGIAERKAGVKAWIENQSWSSRKQPNAKQGVRDLCRPTVNIDQSSGLRDTEYVQHAKMAL